MMTQNEDKTLTAFDLYCDHPLFARCIGISCPIGWTHLITELVDWIDDYNVKNNCFIGFGQIKLKWNWLTIYVEHYLKEDEYQDEEQFKLLTPVQEKIKEISETANRTCQTCSKKKVETVVDTEVRFVCFDHMQNGSGWRRREI